MAAEIRHPLFARFFDRLSHVLEKDLGPRRDELLDGLTGRVLELGAGNGINFGHYPAGVEEVVAVEPEPFMRAKAERAAASAPVRVTVTAGVAERLPFEDEAFDAVVASLVLCSISDVPAGLGELRRVVRAGGELRFLEHVRAEGGAKPRVQDALDRSRLWPLIGGGCHCSRDTVGVLGAAGFRVERVRSLDVGPSWGVTNPHVIGVAVRG
jgi:ubiquinone/menaquinone biosynthesis C-methylase UbiE